MMILKPKFVPLKLVRQIRSSFGVTKDHQDSHDHGKHVEKQHHDDHHSKEHDHHEHHDHNEHHDHHDHHDHHYEEILTGHISFHGHAKGHHGFHAKRPKVEYNTITAFLDHKNIKTYLNTGPGHMKYEGVEYGTNHYKEYDWRDDPRFNEDITLNSRHLASWMHPAEMVYPFVGKPELINPYSSIQSNDYLYSPHLILRPENKRVGQLRNGLTSSFYRAQDDVNHEYEYESEDLDYQPESFRTQHFRKKGGIFFYAILAAAPLLYFWAEFLYQHYPDDDHWRIAHPPPLNYPDTEDTDDTDTFNDYQKREVKLLRDSGVIGELWYDIVDGKKVYHKWAGVNQPLDDI